VRTRLAIGSTRRPEGFDHNRPNLNDAFSPRQGELRSAFPKEHLARAPGSMRETIYRIKRLAGFMENNIRLKVRCGWRTLIDANR